MCFCVSDLCVGVWPREVKMEDGREKCFQQERGRERKSGRVHLEFKRESES